MLALPSQVWRFGGGGGEDRLHCSWPDRRRRDSEGGAAGAAAEQHELDRWEDEESADATLPASDASDSSRFCFPPQRTKTSPSCWRLWKVRNVSHPPKTNNWICFIRSHVCSLQSTKSSLEAELRYRPYSVWSQVNPDVHPASSCFDGYIQTIDGKIFTVFIAF